MPICASPNFENFVQAAVKGLLAMSELMQSPSASRSLWGNVCFGRDFVCLSPNKRHFGRGWECLKV